MGTEQANKLARVGGTYARADEVNERLDWASKQAHLVSPATSVGQLPEGCGIALSLVTVDAENETFNTQGKRSLSKSALDRIGAAAGVSWDPDRCGRVDNGSDPYYCHFKVVGSYRAFDGQVQIITAEKEMDLREGSPQLDELRRQAANAKPVRSADPQISAMRMHILAHAESKAKLRAIRSLGIRSSYNPAELQKPFVVARIMFTGQTSDPELRRDFAHMTASSFLTGNRALYGDRAPSSAAPSAPALPVATGGHAPPPLNTRAMPSGGEAFCGGGSTPNSIEQDGKPTPAQTTSAGGTPPRGGDFVIPGGRSKGTPIAEADDKDLEYWTKRIGDSIADGSSRNAQRDKAMHAAMMAELAKRNGHAGDFDDEDPFASPEEGDAL